MAVLGGRIFCPWLSLPQAPQHLSLARCFGSPRKFRSLVPVPFPDIAARLQDKQNSRRHTAPAAVQVAGHGSVL